MVQIYINTNNKNEVFFSEKKMYTHSTTGSGEKMPSVSKASYQQTKKDTEKYFSILY